jgi:hypothetical protein
MKYRIKEFLKNFYHTLSKRSERIKKNKKYLIIRRTGENLGLGSYIITNLGAIHYAVLHGVVPIIDMKTEKNCCLPLEKQGKQNAWNLYFEQPCSIKKEEITKKNAQITYQIYDIRPNDSMEFFTNEELVRYWRKLVKTYMPFNKNTKKYLEKKEEELFSGKKNILGVLCRGTDYVQLKPFGHPVQPSLEEIEKKIDDLIELKTIDYIFLATEDASILSHFKKRYASRLLYIDGLRYTSREKKYLAQMDIENKVDIIQKNLDYLATLYLLAKCDFFIGGRTSGTVCAMLLSSGFKYTYFWNKGRYGIDDDLKLERGDTF